MAKIIHLRRTLDDARPLQPGRDSVVCWNAGDTLTFGEALPIIADGHPAGAPPPNEEDAMWGTWTLRANEVTCPACLRVLGRG